MGKNPQVMLKLGRAQGAAIAAALKKDIPIFEYAPRSVKLSITGKGAASKEQVAAMVQNILGINYPQKYLDATDALAIALCHYYHGIGGIQINKSSGSWEQFVKNNSDRVK
jgi:Holliday junction resolvasome, endonuclease subunit